MVKVPGRLNFVKVKIPSRCANFASALGIQAFGSSRLCLYLADAFQPSDKPTSND